MTFNEIEKIVSEKTCINLDLIHSRSRKTDYVFARRLICVYARAFLNMSLVEIAKLMSLDHATVIHHIRNFEYDIAYDIQRREIAKQVKDEIQKCSLS